MRKRSAGFIMYRYRGEALEIFLVHMGGPYWAKKDLRAWSIPKGEFSEGEDPFEVAKREFFEETGVQVKGDFEFNAYDSLRAINRIFLVRFFNY